MVCNRCIAAVQAVFDDLKIDLDKISLGEAETITNISEEELKLLTEKLKNQGFEILQEQSQKITEQVKKLIISEIAKVDIAENFVLSEFISSHLHRDFSAVSKLFSQTQMMTLEQYFILQKIEKVKELLFYNELTLTEIAGKLGYKSVQHLSAQFKNITGLTPSDFKKLKENTRQPLDFF